MVPFGAGHLLQDRRTSGRKVAAAVDRAVAAGADLVGLGGLTAPVTNGGMVLRRRTDIGVTNGNAFTAAIVHRQVEELLARAPHGRVAVVGATGSVGSAVTMLLARDGDAAELVLVATGSTRLDLARRPDRRPGSGADRATDRRGRRLRHRGAVDRGRRHRPAGRASARSAPPCWTPPSPATPVPSWSGSARMCVLLDGGVVEVPGLPCTAGRWACLTV